TELRPRAGARDQRSCVAQSIAACELAPALPSEPERGVMSRNRVPARARVRRNKLGVVKRPRARAGTPDWRTTPPAPKAPAGQPAKPLDSPLGLGCVVLAYANPPLPRADPPTGAA